jgi:hypothetical protein
LTKAKNADSSEKFKNPPGHNSEKQDMSRKTRTYGNPTIIKHASNAHVYITSDNMPVLVKFLLTEIDDRVVY